MAKVGLEPISVSDNPARDLGKTDFSSGANSGAVLDTSAAMAAFVNTLTAEQRAALAVLLGNANEAKKAN